MNKQGPAYQPVSGDDAAPPVRKRGIKRSAVLFAVLLSIVLIGLAAASMSQPLSSPAPANLSALSAEFSTLRSVKGHFEGGDDFIPDVDGPNGKKRQTMNALLAVLGQPGTPAASIFEAMGKPDEVSTSPDVFQNAVPLLPGPVVPTAGAPQTSEAMYLIYYWRGRHDYLYFQVDAGENVVRAAWFNALD
ncbi:uncharacterized protein BJ171DRAFT_6271 [Polychytrium aggregatum]|uniref:uncharacterized protein n=1 Tax=Polychytrium aggregatum TaxID=110093 RepID=UPI0022FE44B6|nr:uncharacterized protein BJ171DRAFT_6271 [Polychytrium aggregatum]KAI9209709.1 hypothetical protein BJ171DRAFT_6271 [Polychytrium aggregatum]